MEDLVALEASPPPSSMNDGEYVGASVVQQVAAAPGGRPVVVPLLDATVVVDDRRLVARAGPREWAWYWSDVTAIHHGTDGPWSILVVEGIGDHGVSVQGVDADRFRAQIADVAPLAVEAGRRFEVTGRPMEGALRRAAPPEAPAVPAAPVHSTPSDDVVSTPSVATEPVSSSPAAAPAGAERIDPAVSDGVPMRGVAANLEARGVSAWFGDRCVLDRVSLDMNAREVTALIGPSGCGKSTFLRILNRMHELIPTAGLAGEVLLDGHDIYDPSLKLTDARRRIGMVFQKPNPFPAMSIYDNVIAGLRLIGAKASRDEKDELVETCLAKAGLWAEVRDRLRQPGGSLSGGQQQRLCIARSLAVRPQVLLMDEPCSALDPTSTRRIEQTIGELASEVTIVIVTHNMQQAARVSDRCAFFLAEQGRPGVIVEYGETAAMFDAPQDQRTSDYVHGRFG